MSRNYNSSEFSAKRIFKWCAVAFAAVLVLAVLCSSVYKVAPGFRGVLVVLGKVQPHSYVNGVGVKWPFISDMVPMDIRTTTVSEKTSSYTADVQTAELSYTFTYDLVPGNVHILYETVGTDYVAKKLKPVLNDVLKDVIGRWQAQDLVANRDKARTEVLNGLRERLDKRFFQNLTFQIIEVDYSDAFEKAIENKVIADQKAQEAANNTRRVQEEANQKIISAKAEAEAMEIKTAALAKNHGLTEYEAVQKWDGKLPNYMMGGTVPFLNLGTVK